MGRWARWQSYLFWGSLAGASAAILGLLILEITRAEWRHVLLFTPAVLLLPVGALLYRERVRALVLSQASEAQSRLLLEEASDAIFVSDIETRRFIEVNRMAAALTGYPREELLSMRADDLVASPTDISEVTDVLKAGGAFRGEQMIVTRDGSHIPIEVTATAVSGAQVQAIVRPIGERKAIEEGLRRSEEVFRAVSELTTDFAFSMTVEQDGSLRPDWLTGAYERVTGYTIDEAVGSGRWPTIVHPDDLHRVSDGLAAGLQSGRAGEIEFRIVTKTGDIRYLRALARYERNDPRGPVVRIVGAVSDITDQKMLEESLHESQQLYRRLYERLPVGIYRRRWKGEALDCNPAYLEMFGFPDEDAVRAYVAEDFYADPRDREVWLRALETSGVVRNFEVLYKRYDGTTFWGRNTSRLFRDADGRATIEGAIIDITEERELNDELKATLRDLRRADLEKKRLLTHLVRAKEEERNRVASDIHDDSVQLMTAAAIELERLARKLPDEELRASLERLETRVRDAVQRLRKMVFELRPPALDQEGLASALRLYLEEFSLDTGIDYELRNSLEIEPVRPMRVVLFRIAQEALINVRKHSNAACVTVTLERRNDGISMTLHDDGNGFDVSTLDNGIPGHIGVAEMRERAEMAGGKFDLASQLQKGTDVSVWLPEFAG